MYASNANAIFETALTLLLWPRDFAAADQTLLLWSRARPEHDGSILMDFLQSQYHHEDKQRKNAPPTFVCELLYGNEDCNKNGFILKHLSDIGYFLSHPQ